MKLMFNTDILKLSGSRYLKGIVFLASFLLFQIELIIAKILLSKFGGNYTVWGAAVVFFQATLLLGYLYSHIVIKKIGIVRYRKLHIAIILATLLFFPGRALPEIAPIAGMPLVINIFILLSFSIGASFFVLSTTSIIAQSWIAASSLTEGRNPYVLYGISNLGSFAALISYPLFFEVNFGLTTQLATWRGLYFILVILHVAALLSVGAKEAAPAGLAADRAIAAMDRAKFFLLGASGVMLSLSVTNIITCEIAPIPLLWILPLLLYLLSFVLNFKAIPWCPGWISSKSCGLLGFGALFYFLAESSILDFTIKAIAFLFILFILSMLCQNELYRSRPADTGRLTEFYLLVSFGGFAGGVTVSWVMPLVTTSVFEYMLAVFLIAVALSLNRKPERADPRSLLAIACLVAIVIVWPVVFTDYNVFGIALILAAFGYIFSKFEPKPFVAAAAIAALAIISLVPWVSSLWSGRPYIYKHRNYYGLYKIYHEDGKRHLVSGTTRHGSQYTIKSREREPLSYYTRSTPIGKLLASKYFKFSRIGVVGLGTGTIAAYGTSGSELDIFELDPDVTRIAEKYFTFLGNSPSRIRCFIGDARMTIKKMPVAYYDLIVIDAFTGDSIPAHLLTVEAIAEFKERLKPDGILLFHVSNRYLDLLPVLFANAGRSAAYACTDSNRSADDGTAASQWLAITWDRAKYDTMLSRLWWEDSSYIRARNIRPWTDDHTHVLSAFRISSIISQITNFKPFYLDAEGASQRSKIASLYRSRGDSYLSADETDKAIECYRKAAKERPRSAASYFGAGIAYYKKKDYVLSAEQFRKASKLDPADPGLLYNLGKACARSGDTVGAIEAFEKALELKPDDTDTVKNLAMVRDIADKIDLDHKRLVDR